MKLGRYILIVLIIIVFGYYFNDIQIKKDVIVAKWDSYQAFFQSMSSWDRWMMKIYMRSHGAPTLYPGVYRFEKSLWYKEFLEVTSTPPKPVTAKITLLEGWSSYDFDALLAKKWYAASWVYRSYITDQTVIESLRKTYSFLPLGMSTLEWFLYPDTYNVDINKSDVIEQLVKLQLQNFNTKVRSPYGSQFASFDSKLKAWGFDFKMSTYSIIKLASIIENEEKAQANKATIAWLFLNRINTNMQLWADVTLCYGLAVTYDLCTPAFIVEHLYDKQNPYNTRQQSGLPPTPISNPSLPSITSVLDYVKSDYLYYLHDNKGKIYYGSSLQEHNANKSKYLP